MSLRTSDFDVSVHSLLFQPEFYPFDFNQQAGYTRFLLIRENILEQAPFIDSRIEVMAQASFRVPTSKLMSLEGEHDIDRPPINYIFHHSFVCSTLLARCMNQIDAFFSLKEPWILRRLADTKRAMPIAGAEWQDTFRKYNALLSRDFSSGKSTVVKATNVASNLLVDVISFMPASCILYLWSDLRSFLVSNLKKTAATQKKMPLLYKAFASDSDFGHRFSLYTDASDGSLLRVCALIWAANLYNLQRLVGEHPGAAVKTLEMDALITEPRTALQKTSDFFGHSPNQEELDLMTHDDILRRNAKDPRQTYGDAIRREEAQRIEAANHLEIDATIEWISPLIDDLDLIDFMRGHAV